MANYESLKNDIESAIKQNGNQEITGEILQNTLIEMVESLTKGKQFMGFADPSTVPISIINADVNVWYLAITPGNYANFLGVSGVPLTLGKGFVSIIYNQNDRWIIVSKSLSFAENSIPASSLEQGVIPEITTDWRNASEKDVSAASLTNSLYVNKVGIYSLFSMKPFVNRVSGRESKETHTIQVYHPLISLFNDSELKNLLPFQEIEIVLMVYQKRTGKKDIKNNKRTTPKKGWCSSCKKTWIDDNKVQLEENLTFQLNEVYTSTKRVEISERTIFDWIVQNYIIINGVPRYQMSGTSIDTLESYMSSDVSFGKSGAVKSRLFGIAIRAKNPDYTWDYRQYMRENGVDYYVYTGVFAFRVFVASLGDGNACLGWSMVG